MGATTDPSVRFAPLRPYDEHNQVLEANVHPRDWSNRPTATRYHLVVIGAGTAGLVTAAGAAGLGARVALVERELMGGDCLNVGCVPSKALLAAARVAASAKRASEFGVDRTEDATVDFSTVMERMRCIRAAISKVDSAKRFGGLGVDVFFGDAAFCSEDTVNVTAADGSVTALNYSKAVVATGARASPPSIDGLDTVNYLTNETLFSLTEVPRRFGVIGSGPIGAEMSQAFQRLGSEVHLFERQDRILAREDVDASAIVQRQLEADGVDLVLNASDLKVRLVDNNRIEVSVLRDGKDQRITVDQLLVATGRAPNVESLNLEAVEFHRLSRPLLRKLLEISACGDSR
jgi:pyruvate/2-oxoglutarate dehydrogenase complex dihydrolipoamide dehydrogenase (E3) component